MKEIHDIEYEGCTTEEWKRVLDAMHSGKEVRVHDSIYWYFLEVLPPKKMVRGGFIFAEGADDPILFRGLTPESRTAQQFPNYQALSDAVSTDGYSLRIPAGIRWA